MNDEQKDKVKSFLQQKWKDPRICKICAASDWGIEEGVFEVRGLHDNTKCIPMIAAICGECGNTCFFGAIKAGAFS